MYFQELQLRLIAALKERVRSGEATERGLALKMGISQPHIHNVLKGARLVSPQFADQILRRLKLSIFDLLDPEDLRAALGRRMLAASFAGAPLLEDPLGPGYRFPVKRSLVEQHPFPVSLLSTLTDPMAVRLAADEEMAGDFAKGDLALLDFAPARRAAITPGALYAIAARGEGLVRRLRRGRRTLEWNGGSVPVSEQNILSVVRASLVWLGRDLRSREMREFKS